MNKAQKKALTDARRKEQHLGKKHRSQQKKRRKYANAIGNFIETIVTMKYRKDTKPNKNIRWFVPSRADTLFSAYPDRLDTLINRLEK